MRLLVLLLLGAVGLGLASACSGAHESRHDAVSTVAPLDDTPRLNVPGLLALSIDELGRQIGQARPVPPAFKDPTLLSQQKDAPVDSTAWFQHRGLNLVVTYDYQSRQVKDLLLLGGNEDELMRQGQLQLSQASYLVLPVFQPRRPTELMGLRVLALNPH